MASELQRQHRTSLKEQSVQTITNNNFTWMDVQNPTKNNLCCHISCLQENMFFNFYSFDSESERSDYNVNI